MKVDRETLLELWRQVERTAPSGREWRAISLGAVAPVKLLAGIREPDGRAALLVEAPIGNVAAPLFRMQADGVTVADQRDTSDGSGLRRVAVVLERPELHEVFVTLVLDLVEVAGAAASADIAYRDITARLSAWQAFLHARRRGLSEAEQIGLMGELEVLRLASKIVGFGPAIASWQGPLDGLHDFTGVGAAVEVKSTLGPASLIRISDAEQLDTRGVSRLMLARPKFRSTPDGTDLAACVQSVRTAVQTESPADLSRLDDKLLRAGFIAQEFRSGVTAAIESISFYDVRDDFPRIIPAVLPAAVTKVTYALDERALRPFEIGPDETDFIIRQLGTAHE